MALIKDGNLTQLQKQKNNIHDETNCTYLVFVADDGEKYFQIDTYGSKDRKILGKTSQSIQFDKKSATKLVELLKAEFRF